MASPEAGLDNDIEQIPSGLTDRPIHQLHWGQQIPPDHQSKELLPGLDKTDQTGYNNYVNPPPTPEDSSQLGLSAACLLNVSQDVQYLGAGAADRQAPPNCSSPDSQLPWVHHVQGGFYYGGYDPRFRFPQPDPEGEYPASRDFRNSIPQIPPPPPGSPDLPASMLTLEGSTGNEEEFKTADEIWDKGVSGYKTMESPGSTEYPFVVRRRFGKPNTDPNCYIDIKSEGLRAIVLQALEDDNNASAYIGEEGITVDLNVLLNCLPQLEDRLAAPSEHLKRLVEFLKLFQEINTPPTTHSEGVEEIHSHMSLPAPATHSKEVDMSSVMRPVEVDMSSTMRLVEVDMLSMMSPVEVDMSLAMRPVEQEQPRSHSGLEDDPGQVPPNCSSSEKHDPQDSQPPPQCSFPEEHGPSDSQLPEACHPQPPPLSGNPVVRTDQTGYSDFVCPLRNPEGDERAGLSAARPQVINRNSHRYTPNYSLPDPQLPQPGVRYHPQLGLYPPDLEGEDEWVPVEPLRGLNLEEHSGGEEALKPTIHNS